MCNNPTLYLRGFRFSLDQHTSYSELCVSPPQPSVTPGKFQDGASSLPTTSKLHSHYVVNTLHS
jgi:hypothetical protein